MGNHHSKSHQKRGLMPVVTKDFQSVLARPESSNSKSMKRKSSSSSLQLDFKEPDSPPKRLIRPNGIDFIIPNPPPLSDIDLNDGSIGLPNTSPSQELQFELTEGQNRRNLMSDAEFECTEIGEYLFVGGSRVATSWEVLQSKKITRIVNCSASVVECAFADVPGMKYLVLNMVDGKQDDISWFFCEVINFIYSGHLLGEKTLLHCEKGISRSCSFAIAYGIWYAGCAWKVAFNFVKERRKVCAPNTAFTCNLIEIDDLLNGPSRSIPLIFRCASHLAHDTHTPVLKLCRDQMNKRQIIPPSTSMLDPRGIFVVRTAENILGVSPTIFVWRGSDAFDDSVEIAVRLAGFMRGVISTAEDVVVVQDGAETPEFLLHLERNGRFDRERSTIFDDLFDQNRFNEPDETFTFISAVERSMRASSSGHENTFLLSQSAKSRIMPYTSSLLSKTSISPGNKESNQMSIFSGVGSTLDFSSRNSSSSAGSKTARNGIDSARSLHKPLGINCINLNVKTNGSPERTQSKVPFVLNLPMKRSGVPFLRSSRVEINGNGASSIPRPLLTPNSPQLIVDVRSGPTSLQSTPTKGSSWHRHFSPNGSPSSLPRSGSFPTLQHAGFTASSSVSIRSFTLPGPESSEGKYSLPQGYGMTSPDTSRSGSTLTSGPVHALNSERLDVMSQEYRSPRAMDISPRPYNFPHNEFSPRVSPNTPNRLSRARTEILPGQSNNSHYDFSPLANSICSSSGSKTNRLPLPPLPNRNSYDNNQLPMDIGLIRGPTPIEELVPVVTGDLSNRDSESPHAPIYSPQYIYGAGSHSSARMNRSSSFLGLNAIQHSSRPNSPKHGPSQNMSHLLSSRSKTFTLTGSREMGLRRSSSSMSLTSASVPSSPSGYQAPEFLISKPRLFQAITSDGKQYTWEYMGVYDEADLQDNMNSIMLLSCPVMGSFLWIGHDATVPFFSKISSEVVRVPACSLTEAELRKWARLVHRPQSASGEVHVPYVCEEKFKDDNLFIEKSGQETRSFWNNFDSGF